MADRTQLFDTDHPYYCTEGCYYDNGHHHKYESWQSFIDDMGDSDEDYNLLFRWDWRKRESGWFDDEGRPEADKLMLYFFLQRKAAPLSFEVDVRRDEEPEIHGWLQERVRTLALIWEPINVVDRPVQGETE